MIPFHGEIIPKVGFSIVAEDWLMETKSLRRMHNRISKNAGKAVMLLHWKKYVPYHFKQVNRNRYNHEPRSEGYMTEKKMRFGSVIDLVKTGRTRDYMLTVLPRIQIGGKAEFLMIVHMFLKWPFPAGEAPNRESGQAITRADMNRELETWVQEEEMHILNMYHKTYLTDFRKETKRRPKLTKKFEQHLSA